jgi:hypothetical protein
MDFLAGVRDSKVLLTFEEIERKLGFSLPNSARDHPPWWSNHAGGHVQSKAWLKAGWRTWRVDLKRERVHFVRKADVPWPATPSPDPVAGAAAQIGFDTALLSPAAARLLHDYRCEMGGDAVAALARAVHEAAMARRRRLVDEIVANAPRMPAGAPDSVQLIREDRDVR